MLSSSGLRDGRMLKLCHGTSVYKVSSEGSFYRDDSNDMQEVLRAYFYRGHKWGGGGVLI